MSGCPNVGKSTLDIVMTNATMFHPFEYDCAQARSEGARTKVTQRRSRNRLWVTWIYDGDRLGKCTLLKVTLSFEGSVVIKEQRRS